MPITVIPSSIGGISIPGSLLNGPLGALFKKPGGLNILQYPRDLQSSSRGHVVKFEINEVQPIGIQEGKEYTLKNAIDGTVEASKNLGQKILSNFPSNSITDSIFGGKNQNTETTFNASFEPAKKKVENVILLYMPDTMNFTYEAQYNETSLLEVGKQALEKLPGIVGTATKNIVSTIDSNLGKLALKTQGLAINPNQQLLFDGISLRSFQLSFTFTPYSKQEADTVNEIIKLFKMHSRPRTVTGSGGMLFIPPSTFNIDFQFKGSQNKYLSKVAESVITDIEINYSPNGWAAHTDGSPVQTTLTLSFKEIQLIDRNKIEQGY